MGENNETRGQFYPAITIDGGTTVPQRQRNIATYQRLRDGEPGNYRAGGIRQFVFDVPVPDVESIGGPPPGTVTFRLKPGSECHDRLISYITEHFAASDPVDGEVELLRETVRRQEIRIQELEALATSRPL